MALRDDITTHYGNNVRVRVCGLCWMDGRLLLVNHEGLAEGDFWAPPGGGVEFGTPLGLNLSREFEEETGITIESGPFLFGCEYIHGPLHAVELFFDVRITGGRLKTGHDPELQIIKSVQFFTPEQVSRIPEPSRHGIFRYALKEAEFRKLSGFYGI